MTPQKAFELFPSINEVYTVGSETFLKEEDAASYSTHFNLGKPQKVERPASPKADKKAGKDAGTEDTAKAEKKPGKDADNAGTEDTTKTDKDAGKETGDGGTEDSKKVEDGK